MDANLRIVDDEADAAQRYGQIVRRLRALGGDAAGLAEASLADPHDLVSLARMLLQREEELKRLFDLVETVQRGVMPEEVLNLVFDSFRDLIPYQRIGCAFLTPDRATLVAHWARSELGAVKIGKGYSQPMAGSSLLDILASGRPRIINDLEAYLRAKPDSAATRCVIEEGGRSSLTCPLIVDGRPIGFLFFTSREAGVYRDLHPEIFRQIAAQLSLVIERSRMFERVHRAANYDALTGLPNRAMFSRKLAEALETQDEAPVALCYLDLDHFKNVNDTLGHPVGDRLLASVARRLERCVGERGLVARLGGDEFAVILAPLADPEQATRVAAELIEAVRPALREVGHEVEIGVSVGVATSIGETATAEALVRRADLALYDAKARGRGAYGLFESSMETEFRARVELERAVRQAVAQGAIYPKYQPIVSLPDARIIGFEALARWDDPQRGSVSPGVFIPLVESCGLIDELGAQMLRRACRDAATWPPEVRLSVNVSARQLESGDFARIARDALEEAKLAPERLDIELTESSLALLDGAIAAQFNALAELGVSISLDDFGTGFSSLSYLRRFRFSRVKIDRSFVACLPQCQETMAIVRAVDQMSRALRMTVSAEGVETEEQLRAVTRLGCGEVQGFLISMARAADDLPQMLRDHGREGLASRAGRG